mmetsp:Transcript_24194/g.67084  ORF Transcript_24194/g.67084 Transcript_24194/m.67084 type:complete len:209 (+) Transcript_24194:1445-2071(+)
MSQVQKQGSFLIIIHVVSVALFLLAMLFNNPRRLSGKYVSRIVAPFIGNLRAIASTIFARVPPHFVRRTQGPFLVVRKVIRTAVQIAKKALKSSKGGRLCAAGVAEVPFPHGVSLVTDFAQDLGEGFFVQRQSLCLVIQNNGMTTRVQGVSARHERRPRRRTGGQDVVVAQENAVPAQLIDRRRLDVTAVTTQVAAAQIVNHDKDNVG